MSEQELKLQKQLLQEKDYSLRLRRMVIFFSVAFGYSLGALIGMAVILYITKI